MHLQNTKKDSMNRNKADQMPTLQIQFLQNICLPLYNVKFIYFNTFE